MKFRAFRLCDEARRFLVAELLNEPSKEPAQHPRDGDDGEHERLGLGWSLRKKDRRNPAWVRISENCYGCKSTPGNILRREVGRR